MKISNKKHKDWNWKNKKKKERTCTFSGREREKRNDSQQQTAHHPLPRTTPIEKHHDDVFKDTLEG